MTMTVDVAPAGQIRLPSRKDKGLVLALALTLYPRFVPCHIGLLGRVNWMTPSHTRM
jgi:hypothetical protein